MADHCFGIVDDGRLRIFQQLARRQLFSPYRVTSQANGLVWAVADCEDGMVAVASLGSNWLFDPFIVEQKSDLAEQIRTQSAQRSNEQHQAILDQTITALSLGPAIIPIVWAIHQYVLRCKRSVFRIPSDAMGRAVWGIEPAAWPRHWRQSLAKRLDSLQQLHIADLADTACLGSNSAVLTRWADLRGSDHDGCDPDCSEVQGHRHDHFLINVGRGFLGKLEQFAATENNGIRDYSFDVRRRHQSGPNLRALGQTGDIRTVYFPAFGNRGELRLAAKQQLILQGILRETTREKRGKAASSSRPEIISGSRVPIGSGRTANCALLESLIPAASFNGNGHRKGQGYRLCTPGGWLQKCGYQPADLDRFLHDLQGLVASLDLTVIGWDPVDQGWYSLDEIHGLAHVVSSRQKVLRLHVRIYASSHYIDKWNQRFGVATSDVNSASDRQDLLIASRLRERGMSRRMASAMQIDPSFLSKLRRGLKPWPSSLRDRALEWLDGNNSGELPSSESPSSLTEPATDGELASYAAAREYLARGWSVVPQLRGFKQPCIRWKEYQSRLPRNDELCAWWGQWPDAGIAIVLGPVSNLFVIDVDGVDAHNALCERLGAEPVAPKVISGSGNPCRYHLFFAHPCVQTKSKAVPWHAKLEFRGQGGIIVAPPSIHPTGRRYVWADQRSPAALSLPPVPIAVADALRQRGRPRAASSGHSNASRSLPAMDVAPSTREFLSGQYSNGPGWNDKLYRAACDMAARGFDLGTAMDLLLAAAGPWDATEAASAERTIRSAFDQPRVPSRR